ncbi:MAG: DUF3299 domain-containing protein [Cyanobacteria bacterium P01_D01_bin.156]
MAAILPCDSMYDLARRRYLLAFLLSVWLVVINAYPLAAQQTITWEDLEPRTTTLQNPYEHLSIDQTHELSMLAQLQLWIDENETGSETFEIQEVERLRNRLESQGLNVEQLLTQVDKAQAYWQEQSQSTNQTLENQSVQLSGYVLPLTWNNEQQVTQFLLVPYVGACIHVPPPPPNQIIHVQPKAAMEPPGLFAPVAVTGQLRKQPASYELFRVDGSRPVEVSYALNLESMVLESPESVSSIVSGPIWQTIPMRVSAVLTQAMGKLHAQRSFGTFLLGLLMAFSYGVLHTLGPGHGKAVIISYFVGKGGSLRRGITMGLRIAIFHVLSAVIVVLLTDTVIRQVGGSTPDNYQVIQLVSYGAIAAIGAWLLWQALRTQSSVHRSAMHRTDPASVLSPDLVQQIQPSRDLCQCFNCIDSEGGSWLSLAIGAVPCSGALLVLLYGLANDLLWPSIAMVLAISAGMAITLAWIGAMAIMGRRYAERRLNNRRQRLTRWVRILGAGCVFLLGLGLFGITLASGGLLAVLP